MKTAEIEIQPNTDICMGYEEPDVFAVVNAKQSDSKDYYAELIKDIKKMKCQS